MQVYANETDWAPFKNLCGHVQDAHVLRSLHDPFSICLEELFLAVFDLGVVISVAYEAWLKEPSEKFHVPEVKLVGKVSTQEDENEFSVLSKVLCIGSWTESHHLPRTVK